MENIVSGIRLRRARAFWPARLPILGRWPRLPVFVTRGLTPNSRRRTYRHVCGGSPGVMEAPRNPIGGVPSPRSYSAPVTNTGHGGSRDSTPRNDLQGYALEIKGVVCFSAESLNVVHRAQMTHRKIPCVGPDAPIAIFVLFRSLFS